VKIDWDKPYGTIWGNTDNGKYVQDEVYFDHHGNEMNPAKDVGWAKEQRGLGGRNLLMSYAREHGVSVDNNEKISSVRKKVIAHMS